jgi:branched-chain amino acid transport system permease protein
MSVGLFFQLLANGIMCGGMYALVASGLTLTLGVVKVFNFAQGDFLMLGSYLAFTVAVTLGLPYWVAILTGLIGMSILGGLIYLGFIQPVIKYGFFNSMIISVLLVTIIEQISVLTFAQQTQAIPPVFPGTINISDVVFSRGKLLVIACSIAVLVGLYYFMKLKVGKAMLASAENSEVATLQGINAKRIFLITMAVGCGLSGIAGAIVAPVYGAYVSMGSMVFSRALLVLMVGGMGSMSGALIGAFLIGILESFTFQFVGYLNLVVILVLVSILIFFRPGGLLGKPMPIPGE